MLFFSQGSARFPHQFSSSRFNSRPSLCLQAISWLLGSVALGPATGTGLSPASGAEAFWCGHCGSSPWSCSTWGQPCLSLPTPSWSSSCSPGTCAIHWERSAICGGRYLLYCYQLWHFEFCVLFMVLRDTLGYIVWVIVFSLEVSLWNHRRKKSSKHLLLSPLSSDMRYSVVRASLKSAKWRGPCLKFLPLSPISFH